MNRPLRIWFDTEFNETIEGVELISIGMVDADGRELYCEAEWDRADATEFVWREVIPHLHGEPMSDIDIAGKIREFVGPREPHWFAYFGTYDFYLLMRVFGGFMAFPWPQWFIDLHALDLRALDLPPSMNPHHALDDALLLKRAHHEQLYRPSPVARQETD